MGIRIYDAEFGTADGSDHASLEKFWWVDDLAQTRGTWTKEEAYAYVMSKPEGWVYVSEDGSKVSVWGWENTKTDSHWIQTHIDDVRRDNLTELAERHRKGLPNV